MSTKHSNDYKVQKGEWGSSIDLEGNFSDLYSNVDLQTLKKYVKMGSEMAGISKTSQNYIINLLEVNSRHFYFREPSGIFHSDKGYSMGDHSAGRGSEVSLKGSEIESFRLLEQEDYGLPMVVTGKKLHQYIFNVRKMRKILNF